jgi:hypothetical protein
MIGATVATIAIVSGMFGGAISSVFIEVYQQRRAQEEVGEFDE